MNQKSQTPYLYHYTTTEGFKGIIESQELWATSIYYLNDWKEFVLGRDAFIERAKALLKNKEATDAAEQLLSYLYDAHPPLFVCSFSVAEDGDDLSQWRAYCPKGGCAIGFPTFILRNYAGGKSFDLWRCEYDTIDARRFVENLTKIMEHIFKMAGGVNEFRAPFPFKDYSKNGFLSLLLSFIAKYKHKAFEAEEEHRLVHLLMPREHPRTRISNNVLVPHVAFSLKNVELWRQAQIVMSPDLPSDAELRRESVRTFLESEFLKHNLPTDCTRNIRLSKIPYRSSL